MHTAGLTCHRPICFPEWCCSFPVQDEEVEKSCEACGAANLPHCLRHTLRRLPRVLVLHMKRFKAKLWDSWLQSASIVLQAGLYRSPQYAAM